MKYIVEIIGGLGNQMFQYAFALSLKNKFGQDTVCLYIGNYSKVTDNLGYELKKVFGIDEILIINSKIIEKLIDKSQSKISKLRRRLFGQKKSYFGERIFKYDPYVYEYIQPQHLVFLSGAWQDEDYFSNIKKIILKSFSFVNKLSTRNEELRRYINTVNSVSMHIRRGDYISNEKYRLLLGNICNYSYYLKSVEYIETYQKHLVYFIFSDDIEWVKCHFDFLHDRNVIYVDHNTDTDSSVDMQLMSYCNHNIIANSTFSWWGAWLNQNPTKIVIAPNRWFRDSPGYENNHIVPDDWIKIDVE